MPPDVLDPVHLLHLARWLEEVARSLCVGDVACTICGARLCQITPPLIPGAMAQRCASQHLVERKPAASAPTSSAASHGVRTSLTTARTIGQAGGNES